MGPKKKGKKDVRGQSITVQCHTPPYATCSARICIQTAHFRPEVYKMFCMA
jgi:hypothetical protein